MFNWIKNIFKKEKNQKDHLTEEEIDNLSEEEIEDILSWFEDDENNDSEVIHKSGDIMNKGELIISDFIPEELETSRENYMVKIDEIYLEDVLCNLNRLRENTWDKNLVDKIIETLKTRSIR